MGIIVQVPIMKQDLYSVQVSMTYSESGYDVPVSCIHETETNVVRVVSGTCSRWQWLSRWQQKISFVFSKFAYFLQ